MLGRFLRVPSARLGATLPWVRRIVVLVASAVAVSACGSSAASGGAGPLRIAFGVAGGNIVPWRVTIEPTGRVRATGMSPRRHRLSQAKVVALSRLVRRELPALRSRQCAGTLPDVGSDFIRAAGRSVRVHGGCEPRFHRLWNTLGRAVGLHLG
jgi:hypothetical protein